MAALLPKRNLLLAPTPTSPLGCSILDAFLRGGLPCGLITELTGEATAGKTQLVLQSLLSVQLPRHLGGLEGSAVYINTDGGEPLKRLSQLIETHRFASVPGVSLEHVHYLNRANTPQALLHAAQVVTSKFLANAPPGKPPVRLLVIDSVANVFRDVGDGPQLASLTQRADQLFQLAALLKRLASQYQLAVVLTNQVMDDINAPEMTTQSFGLPPDLGLTGPAAGGGRSAVGPLVTSGRKVLPSLGLAWANCVNIRLFAGRHTLPDGGTLRSLQVVFAPHLPPSFCCFEIQHDGVWGVAFGEQQEDEDGDGARGLQVHAPGQPAGMTMP